MASPAEIAHILPETLPEDFSEWDGEKSPTAPPAGSGALKGSGSFGAVLKPSAQFPQQQVPGPQLTVPRKVDEVRPQPSQVKSSPAPAQLPSAPRSDRESSGRGPRSNGAPRISEAIPAASPQTTPFGTNDVHFPLAWATDDAAEDKRHDPLPPTAYPDREAVGRSLRAIGAALKTEPAAAPLVPPTARSTNDDSYPPTRPGGAALNAQRGVPALLQQTVSVDDEDLFRQLRTIGNGLNSPAPKPAPEPAPARATDQTSIIKPAPEPAPARNSDRLSIRPAPEPAPARTTERLSIRPIPSYEAVERNRPAQPIAAKAKAGAAAAVRIPTFHSDLDDLGDETLDRKKRMKVVVIGVAAFLLIIILGVLLLSPARATLAKQSVEPPPSAADTAPVKHKHKPSASVSGIQPDTSAEDYISPQIDSKSMSDQLAASARIPQDVKVMKPREEEAPPSDGINVASAADPDDPNAIGGAFNQRARPKVAYVPYPIETVSAGVADGLLIDKARPVYPKEAWYDGISGKVVLEATVSRDGSVENLRLVSGPHIFREAALDAVKTWRYKPYVIDNVPREFQTTVDVIFDQRGGNPLSALHFGSHSKKASTNLASAGTETP